MGKKLNILIISHYFLPLNSIASLRPYSWAKYWSALGHNITVITTKKNIYENRLELSGDYKVKEIDFFGRKISSEEKKINYNKKDQQINNISLKGKLLGDIKKIVYFFRNNYGILAAERIPESIHFWIDNAVNEILKINNEKQIDFIISTYPSPSSHIIAYKVKKKIPTIRWISDYRDSWTVSNYSQPGFPLIKIYEKYLEQKIIKQSDLITTISPSLVEEFKMRFLYKKVELIENGYFQEENIQKVSFKDEINLIYTGSFGGYRSLDFIDSFIKQLKEKDKELYKKIHFYILGEKNEFFDNEKMTFLGKVSHEISLSYQQSADILFLIESDKEIAKGTLTGKFFEYMKAKKYIIAFGPKESFDIAQYLKQIGNGAVSKKDYESVYNSIKKAIKLKDNINTNKIEYFDRKELSYKLLSLMETLDGK